MTIALAEQPPPQEAAPPQGPIEAAVRAKENKKRWIQLIAGIAVMVLLSNYQYSFTLFTPGMSAAVRRNSLFQNRADLLDLRSV